MSRWITARQSYLFFPLLLLEGVNLHFKSVQSLLQRGPVKGRKLELAMLGVHRALRTEGLDSRLLLQVHDELVLEVAPGEQEALEALVRREMGSAYPLDVPLDVSVGLGRTWDEAGH